MNPHKHESDIPQFPVETEYLITDVEELVNKNVGNYLSDQPFRVKIVDYMPEMHETRGAPLLPIGIHRIEKNIIEPVAPGQREFIGIDLLFSFPLIKSNDEENPLNIELKWSDGIHVTLALVDKRPLILASRGEEAEHILYSAEVAGYTMQHYIETLGLPASFWNDDFKDLLGDVYSSRDIKLERHAKYLLDLGTTMELSHDARYMTNDEGEKELVQELCLNIDHSGPPRVDNDLVFAGQTFRNMFRFERNERSDQWKYRGSYAGKLVSGEFIDQLVQEDPQLGIPGSKLLEKAFNFLSQENA